MFNHNKIERSASRVWKLEYLKQVMAACEAAEYDVLFTNNQDEGTVVIGLKDTDQIFLKALRKTQNKGPKSDWIVRFDQKLFDENYSE